MTDLSKMKIGSTTYDLKDNVSTFGGTNLFKWTGLDDYNKELQLNNYQNTGSFTQFTNSLQFDPSQTLGQQYTISFDVISPNGATNIQLYNSNGNPKWFNFGSTVVASNVGNTWVHCCRTITNSQYSGSSTPATDNNTVRRIEIYAPSKMGVKVRNVKVELGNKPTDWTPAPQDLVKVSGTELQFFQ